MITRKLSRVAVLTLVLSWLIVLFVGSAIIAPQAHKAHNSTASHCVLRRAPETDGIPVVCLNTGKIASNDDLRHVCFTDGRGFELYFPSEQKFVAISCDATFFDLPAYASTWSSVVYTTDGNSATIAAWSGDNYVIVFGPYSSYAGNNPQVVAYLQNIATGELIASMARMQHK